MDLFEAACQGVGLALAAGMLGGAVAGSMPGGGSAGARLSWPAAFVLVVAGIAAAYLFGASLDAEDHPAWPGWVAGAALGVFAFAVIRDVVAGAAARAGEGGSPFFIAGIASAAALVLAALSLTPASPVALVVLLALVYLALGRRRRAGEKYEGLRILR
jgi:MYXO-CTERM domain-containing protein